MQVGRLRLSCLEIVLREEDIRPGVVTKPANRMRNARAVDRPRHRSTTRSVGGTVYADGKGAVFISNAAREERRLNAHIRKFLSQLAETFWVLPGTMVLAGVLAAIGLVAVDRSGVLPGRLVDNAWLYNGGGTGARTLLGAVVSSTIGVAGTVFSITIAALALAAGQMGPRLLRNFVRDRGNQFTLGAFLGTFSYALMVLRSVRTQSEGEFVPHLALSVGLLLAFVCVATLVYFVGHMAGRINVDTVIQLVSDDVRSTLERLTVDNAQPVAPPLSYWRDAVPVVDSRHGYLQELDQEGLASWAAKNNTVIRLLVRPGDYVFPGAPIAVVAGATQDVADAIRNATALSPQRSSGGDIEFSVRQLVEVAVRALSPGINDPHTAMSVLDRLGSALCDLVPRHLPTGVSRSSDRVIVVVPSVDYDRLADSMFHLIRQNARGSTVVLLRLLTVLTWVLSAEHDSSRIRTLQRHAELVLADVECSVANRSDLDDVRTCFQRFATMKQLGIVEAMAAEDN